MSKKAKTTAVIESDIVENMDAAASRLGVERADIRRAKKAGCSAFMPGGRINVPQLGVWLDANPAPPAASIPATGPTPPPRPPLPPISDADRLKLSTLEASLASAVEDEVECHRMLKAAREGGDVAALPYLHKAMALARRNRVVAEAAIDKIKVERGEVITWDEHQRSVNRTWYPIVAALHALPRKLAPKLHGLEDVAAEKAIAVAIEGVIAEGRRSLETPPDVAFHLNVWLLSVLEGAQADPTAAVNTVEKLLAEVKQFIATRQGSSASAPTSEPTI
jgi:hypothetical protein